VNTVRASTEHASLPASVPTATGLLLELVPCMKEEVRRLITMASTKSCALDPIPTFLLKEVIDVLLPYLTSMVNASLREGRLPQSQKYAVVTPVLKKAGLNADELKNYRPVSNDVHVEAGGEGCAGASSRHLEVHRWIDASISVCVQTFP